MIAEKWSWRRIAAALGMALASLAAGDARADEDARAAEFVDGVAIRFFAPDTGGASRPRFITHRELSFLARLEAVAESDDAPDKVRIEVRHLRSAANRHISDELLASLPFEPPPTTVQMARVVKMVREMLALRVGGQDKLKATAGIEGISATEIDAMVLRRARAALYLDRYVSRVLHARDDQLREVFRASPHPFKNRAFDEVRPAFELWFTDERLRAVEASFYQTARSRTHVAYPRD